eukprot:1182332-Prorocentrum_minimum.AAC.2
MRLLRFTGPPAPITAREHSTPQRAETLLITNKRSALRLRTWPLLRRVSSSATMARRVVLLPVPGGPCTKVMRAPPAPPPAGLPLEVRRSHTPTAAATAVSCDPFSRA